MELSPIRFFLLQDSCAILISSAILVAENGLLSPNKSDLLPS